MLDIIDDFSKRAKEYLRTIETRRIFPRNDVIAALKAFDKPLQDDPMAPAEVIRQLDEIGSPATVASSGGRYFGFVIGGVLPAALEANLLAGVWDQNACLTAASPVAAALEEICGKWLLSLLGLPVGTGVGFVTGATMANFTGLAAARHALLQKKGWNVEEKGLFGAPPITVIVGEEVHVSLLKALGLLGMGRERVMRVPADSQGRMRADLIPELNDSTILCIQAGNVNTGAFDPIEEVCKKAQKTDTWVHGDGAFGLWAAASPKRAPLIQGVGSVDSWATDGHKWLNVPYDSGIVFVRNSKALLSAMSTSAAYLIEGNRREPCNWVPEISRRARGIEVWAALCSLGRAGLTELIESNCRHASLFAKRLHAAGYQILNDVVLNQVLVSFGNDEVTRNVITRVQDEGACWCGGTVWQGKTAMRISVSSWKTTDEDVERSVSAIIRVAADEIAAM